MKQSHLKIIIQNKSMYHKYFIEKKIESGIALLGWEVKSIRAKTIAINNSYVSFHNQEAYIYNSIFQPNITSPANDSKRIRKLLLKKNELLFLMSQVTHSRYTIVVLDLYWKGSWIKANLGIAKGKKKYDKRFLINKNTWRNESMQIIKKINH